MAAPRPLTRRVFVETALASAAVGAPAWWAVRGTSPTGRSVPPPLVVGAAAAVDRAALTARLEEHQATRGGTMGLAVHDLRTGASFSWREFENESLSTIKVLILVACLKRLQDSGEAFSDSRHSQARRMIQSSDNVATDNLLAWVGVPAVQAAAAALNLAGTTVRGGGPAGSATWWGYSTTTPADLVTLLNAVVIGTPLIHAGHRAYLRHLMAGVVPGQRWGVADPPLTSGVYTETKNGWGPLPGGYRLNSIGRVLGEGRSYTMALLTRSPQGFRHGKETINGLTRIVHDALAAPLAPE